jgi:hypothetical protein
MTFKGLTIDLVGLAQVLMGAAALVTALAARRKAKEKANEKRNEDA